MINEAEESREEGLLFPSVVTFSEAAPEEPANNKQQKKGKEPVQKSDEQLQKEAEEKQRKLDKQKANQQKEEFRKVSNSVVAEIKAAAEKSGLKINVSQTPSKTEGKIIVSGYINIPGTAKKLTGKTVGDYAYYEVKMSESGAIKVQDFLDGFVIKTGADSLNYENELHKYNHRKIQVGAAKGGAATTPVCDLDYISRFSFNVDPVQAVAKLTGVPTNTTPTDVTPAVAANQNEKIADQKPEEKKGGNILRKLFGGSGSNDKSKKDIGNGFLVRMTPDVTLSKLRLSFLFSDVSGKQILQLLLQV